MADEVDDTAATADEVEQSEPEATADAEDQKQSAEDARASKVAWPLFDQVIAEAQAGPDYVNPWVLVDGEPRFKIDEAVLTKLLGVPLAIKGIKPQSGVLAIALDVWVAYELRRAGFEPNAVWPRATMPRVLPVPVGKLLDGNGLTRPITASLKERIDGKSSVKGVASAQAKVLGKLYEKQIDAGMSRWETGPEILISTKRMDGSFGKNLANRAEESYGDAKNLRLRYPLAAIGFMFGLRSTVLTQSKSGARAVVDRLTKLSHEDDAYDATCLVMLEYGDATNWADEPTLDALPAVSIRWDAIPENLRPDIFFTTMVNRVLEVTPENYHRPARERLAAVRPDELPSA